MHAKMFLKKREAEKETFQQTQPCRALVFSFFFSDRSSAHGDPQAPERRQYSTTHNSHGYSHGPTQEQKKRGKERQAKWRASDREGRGRAHTHTRVGRTPRDIHELGGRTYDSIAPLISTLN